MNALDFATELGPALSAALARKGYTELTAVQQAVLDPKLAGRDLRITSQTGSGKTLAVGFALRTLASEPSPAAAGLAQPRALVVTPTRELAHQVEQELRWLYAESGGRVASATGGASYRDEQRALAKRPTVVVGTPGRVLDHLRRGAIDPSMIAAVVLDEADRMLDLGFREDLKAILGFAPKGHATHLMSATFPRNVKALADSVQHNAAHVEGTQLGAANVDIDHVIHLVDPKRKTDAIINLLLSNPEEQTLIFSRTRADVADLAQALNSAGFAAASLSGEMEQAARNRALSAFKRGELHVLVATDVAARGIDVQDIGRVIHAEPPTNTDAYTHRSGRTGRAGRKGVSSILASPASVVYVTRLLRQAGVAHRFEPIPSAEALRTSADQRIFAELTKDDPEGFAGYDARTTALAARLVAAGELERTLTRLLALTHKSTGPEPRDVPNLSVEPHRQGQRAPRTRGPGADGPRDASGSRSPSRPGGAPRPLSAGYVPFHVSFGGEHGADARRLLAMVCRRGDIRGSDVGAIRVERNFSIVEVGSDVAASFAQAAAKPDAREPRIRIRPDRAAPLPRGEASPLAAELAAPPSPPRPERSPSPRARPPFAKRPGGKPSGAPHKRKG